MAKQEDAIVMHHPATGGRTTAIDDKQAAVFEKSGWKIGEAPKPAGKKEN